MDSVFGVLFTLGLLWVLYKIYESLSPSIQREKRVIQYRFEGFKSAVKYIYSKRTVVHDYETFVEFRVPIKNQVENIGYMLITAHFFEGQYAFNPEKLPYYITLDAIIGNTRVKLTGNKTDRLTYDFSKNELHSLQEKLNSDKKYSLAYQSRLIR